MNLVLIITAILLFSGCSALACNHPEALGHHWEVPAYMHEIHFQMAAMVVITIAIIGFSALKRAMRKRGMNQ